MSIVSPFADTTYNFVLLQIYRYQVGVRGSTDNLFLIVSVYVYYFLFRWFRIKESKTRSRPDVMVNVKLDYGHRNTLHTENKKKHTLMKHNDIANQSASNVVTLPTQLIDKSVGRETKPFVRDILNICLHNKAIKSCW